MNVLSFLLLFTLMLVGAISHWVKKKSRKEVEGTILDYFFADYPGRSASVIAILFASAAGAATGDASSIVDPTMLWNELVQHYTIPTISWMAIGGALSWGWQFDSAVNKGSSQ